MGEYIPFEWCKKILSKYGIVDSYTPGSSAKVFQTARVPVGISICYEETYGNLMRESRQNGAEVLVNLTNDVWYPRSRLPIIHFFQGRLRAVEGGVPVLRSCNTGVTGGIDALGRVVAELPYECPQRECAPGVLALALPLYHYSTLYTVYGDAVVIWFSSILFAYLCVIRCVKRKQFIINDLDIYPLRKN